MNGVTVLGPLLADLRRRRVSCLWLIVAIQCSFLLLAAAFFPVALWRYMIPLYPLFVLGGLAGVHHLVVEEFGLSSWRSLLPRGVPLRLRVRRGVLWLALLGLVCVWGVLLAGRARAFRADRARALRVEERRGQGVAAPQVAQWLRENSGPNEAVAAIAIGELGYRLPRRRIIDLGGLIDPGAWTALRSEDPRTALEFLIAREARYYVDDPLPFVWGTLPQAYPSLVEKVAEFPAEEGCGPSRRIYRLRLPPPGSSAPPPQQFIRRRPRRGLARAPSRKGS
jgi:hypothetical protein